MITKTALLDLPFIRMTDNRLSDILKMMAIVIVLIFGATAAENASRIGDLSLSSDHPRLIAKQIDIDIILSKILAGKEPWWSQYQLAMAEADTVADLPYLWDDDKIRQSDWDEYKLKADRGGRRMASLTLAYLYSKEPLVGAKLRTHTLGWCNPQKLALVDEYFTRWNHSHPVATLAIIIAMIYDFNYHTPLFSAAEKTQILDWLNDTVSFIRYRHEQNAYWSNQKAWNNASLILSGLLLQDATLVSWVIDDPINWQDSKDLINKMIQQDGQVCDYWLGCFDIWHSLLTLNAFMLVTSAAVENGYENLLATQAKLPLSLEYYAPLFQTNDINSLPPGYSLGDPPSPYYLYFSGIYEMAHKYLPQNDVIKNTLLDADFNIDTGRFCRVYRRGDSCFFCSRWIKFPLLLWGAEIDYADLYAKIFLQGFYTGSSGMHDHLTDAQALPHLSPYADAPKYVTAWPDSAVDWVYVALYRADGSLAAKESALLRQDGQIMDINGTLGISLEVEPGEYTLAVGHRNHVFIKTQTGRYVSPQDDGIWDLSDSSAQFAAITAVIEVENGIWAARSGDLNQDGGVTTKDYVVWYGSQAAGLSGYLAADFNGDGQVTTDDYYLWLANARAGADAQTDF